MNRRKNLPENNGLPWINPVGGMGDAITVSSLLKIIHDQDPTRKFNLVRRTGYSNILMDHEAIERVGFPEKGDEILNVEFWKLEPPPDAPHRPLQILAHNFGLSTPVEEDLYVANLPEEDPLLFDTIPWGEKNVIISPTSNSPRKSPHRNVWIRIVQLLKEKGITVFQPGKRTEFAIPGVYSLIGTTTPKELIKLVGRCDAVVTCDNFVMHAAHLMGTPAVVAWGPTRHQTYGYPEQIHHQMKPQCGPVICFFREADSGKHIYGLPCPLGENGCASQIDPEVIRGSVMEILGKK